MAKIHQNAEKFPIQWDGDITQVGKDQQNEPAKAPISLYDGYLPYTWGDANFIQEIMDGIGTGSRRARQDRLNKILDDEDKKKRIIHLICRIKGEKVYDDVTEINDVKVSVDDVELVAENIIGKIKLEIKSGV